MIGSHLGRIEISSQQSLVGVLENIPQNFNSTKSRGDDRRMETQKISDSKRCGRALVSPSNSSNRLNQQDSQNNDQFPSHTMPRPLKKRMIDATTMNSSMTTQATAAVATVIEDNESILRRKQLAAKLRANGVSRRMVLKPSAFARSIFLKSLAQKNSSASPIIHLPQFPAPTVEDMEVHQKHSQKLHQFVRKGTDLEGFKKYVQQIKSGGQSLRCCNKFGESLLHLVCRRGRTEMARFLIEELTNSDAEAILKTLAIRDDCFKTPLHDACWTPSPNFELVELILKHAPEQLLMEDIRGNTPFDYVRKEDYNVWLKFLWERKSLLKITA